MTSGSNPSSILLRGGTVLTHDEKNHVISLFQTDVLVRGNLITEIGKGLSPPIPDTEIIDCIGKIVSPGFVDTHHHLWQTQLKGRHVNQGLVPYMYAGNMISYTYSPTEMYWSQLSGCLEAIHCGTTTVLDHAHGIYTADHGLKAIDATLDSGIRAIFAYTVATRMFNWDHTQCVPEQDVVPDWALEQMGDLMEEHNTSASRVEVALRFDLWLLPKNMVLGVFDDLRQTGLRLVTTHVGRNAFMGACSFPFTLFHNLPSRLIDPLIRMHSQIKLLQSYNLLRTPYPPPNAQPKLPFLLPSHGNGITPEDLLLLAHTGTPISSTSSTESQMSLGYPIALDPIHRGARTSANVSHGIDCHSNDPASIPLQARLLLQLARVERNAKIMSKGHFPSGNVLGTTEEVFNLATIRGARCLGLEDQIGSIKVGKKADLVGFNTKGSVGMLGAVGYDPVVAVMRFSEIGDVETVIVDGVVRKRRGRLVGVRKGDSEGQGEQTTSWEEVADEVRRSAREIDGRIGGLNLEKGRGTLFEMYGTDVRKLVSAE